MRLYIAMEIYTVCYVEGSHTITKAHTMAFLTPQVL